MPAPRFFTVSISCLSGKIYSQPQNWFLMKLMSVIVQWYKTDRRGRLNEIQMEGRCIKNAFLKTFLHRNAFPQFKRFRA